MTAMPAVASQAEGRIKAALWFADHGFGVFPCWSALGGVCRCPRGRECSSPGKHPLTEHGFQDATQEASRIRTFLSLPSLPNYGLVCPEGVFALDVDGDGWEAHLAELEARHGPLPATLRTRTRNGLHIFLRWPEGLPRPMKQMFGWVTRWGSGGAAGYVIGPRSVHPSGFEYAPEGSFEIGVLPLGWAHAALEETPSTIRIGGAPDPAAVAVGGRHDFLRDRARFLAGSIRDGDVLLAAMLAINDKLPQPKTRDDVIRAIGEALTKYPADPVEADPESGEIRRVPEEAIGMLGPSAAGVFPAPPGAEAFGGLLGQCALFLAEGTDAAHVGILGSLVAFAGALIPAMAYQHRMQTSSPFVALVGESSVGRKGTAMWRAHDAMCSAVDEVFVNRVMLDGINSGEGLISSLAYKQGTFPYEPTTALVFEEEFASLLAARGRDSSTLDPKLRAAWDGGPLSNRRSNETRTVSPPYWLPALIAITPAELRQRLGADAMQSGSANRWLYLPVQRREEHPEVSEPVLPIGLAEPLRAARRAALQGPPWLVLEVDREVTTTLSEYQDHVSAASIGTARDLTRRLSMTAFRIALVHAAVDRSKSVTIEHLRRAIALTEYAREGIDWVFGGTVGNRDADLLLRSLRKKGSLTKRTIEREVIRDTLRRQDAIDELVRLGYATVATIHETRGRPREELQLSPGGGGFVPFVPGFQNPRPPERPVPWEEGTNSTNGVGRSVDEGGTNPAITRRICPACKGDHPVGTTCPA